VVCRFPRCLPAWVFSNGLCVVVPAGSAPPRPQSGRRWLPGASPPRSRGAPGRFAGAALSAWPVARALASAPRVSPAWAPLVAQFLVGLRLRGLAAVPHCCAQPLCRRPPRPRPGGGFAWWRAAVRPLPASARRDPPSRGALGPLAADRSAGPGWRVGAPARLRAALAPGGLCRRPPGAPAGLRGCGAFWPTLDSVPWPPCRVCSLGSPLRRGSPLLGASFVILWVELAARRTDASLAVPRRGLLAQRPSPCPPRSGLVPLFCPRPAPALAPRLQPGLPPPPRRSLASYTPVAVSFLAASRRRLPLPIARRGSDRVGMLPLGDFRGISRASVAAGRHPSGHLFFPHLLASPHFSRAAKPCARQGLALFRPARPLTTECRFQTFLRCHVCSGSRARTPGADQEHDLAASNVWRRW